MSTWKNTEQLEYEAAAPAVKAHFHALRAEEAWKRDEFAAASREARAASERFIEAAGRVADKRTIDALLLLAENYEYRANEAHARLPTTLSDGVGEPATIGGNSDSSNGSGTATNSAIPSGSTVDATSTSGGHGPGDDPQSRGFTPMSTGLEGLDPLASEEAENQLNQAAAEMDELWRRLHELGLASANSSDKTHVLMSSRHLSSSLGDSFCLLPTKARTPIGMNANTIDGGSTLRAAVASRMRNQRVRLMEKQYGPRAAVDTRLQQQRYGAGASAPRDARQTAEPEDRLSERRSSHSQRSSDDHDIESLQETVSHQKYEIVRLLNTVKTLSNENTTLLKKCDALSQVQEENREIQESMEKFKLHYNQKLVMIKRALEEWRRQKNLTDTVSSPKDAHSIEEHLRPYKEQITQLSDAVKRKDEQIAKYEKWYQTLKAGARAKRANMNADGDSRMGGSGFVRGSFTSSSSLHDYGSGHSPSDHTPIGSSRPPTHSTRRAL